MVRGCENQELIQMKGIDECAHFQEHSFEGCSVQREWLLLVVQRGCEENDFLKKKKIREIYNKDT